jgi:hypothetical protein
MAIFKKTSGVIKRGTAAEAAAFTDGFSASGEGQWSRSMAHGSNDVKLRSEEKSVVDLVVPQKPRRDHVQMLHENRAALQKLLARVARENVPAGIVRLKKQIDNKRAYIAKMEIDNEQQE